MHVSPQAPNPCEWPCAPHRRLSAGAAKIRLADYADVWIAQRPGLRPRAIEIYRGLLRRHVIPCLGNVPPGKIDTPMTRCWCARAGTG